VEEDRTKGRGDREWIEEFRDLGIEGLRTSKLKMARRQEWSLYRLELAYHLSRRAGGSRPLAWKILYRNV
jgi:hypothetical protein